MKKPTTITPELRETETENIIPVREAKFYTRAKLHLIGAQPQIVPISEIAFKDGKLRSVTVKYPEGGRYYSYVTYYFDREYPDDVDIYDIFKGFCE